MADKPTLMSPDRKMDEAVTETFPASDPVSTNATAGNRAVPAEEMLDAHAPEVLDAVTLRRTFPDTESAKIALEGLVRDGPIDRRCAEITNDNGVGIVLKVPANDVQRIQGLLDRA
jgi:hypothetical protein